MEMKTSDILNSLSGTHALLKQWAKGGKYDNKHIRLEEAMHEIQRVYTFLWVRYTSLQNHIKAEDEALKNNMELGEYLLDEFSDIG